MTDDSSESTGFKWLVALNKHGAEWAETNYFTTSLQNATVKTLKYFILKQGHPSSFTELFPYWSMANLLHIGRYFCRCLQILKYITSQKL